VKDFNRDNVSSQPSEMIPLINIESSTPSPSPLPLSLPQQFMLINETNKPPVRIVNSSIHRLKTSSSSSDLMQMNETSSLPTIHSNSSANLNVNRDTDEPDSCYSTIHTLDTNSLRVTNKFLHELRLKRRELHEKGRHLSIDQRIALNRFKYNSGLKRAQDIFDVHFASEDDDDNSNTSYDILNENAQDQIRKKIFYELDRQRLRQFHKQHRQLVVGRALLMLITSVILFMSITLVYVVIDLYHRANNLDNANEEIEFIPMIYDTTDI
jgi:hypothetical protein